jgi:hypothetical protein
VKRFIPALAAAGLIALVAAPGAPAAVKLSGGTTTLTLRPSTAKALGSLGVAVSPTGRAKLRRGTATFPITGGSIDPASAAGRIRHAGGLRLTARGTSVVLKNYRVSIGRQLNLSAKVGTGRMHILKLAGTPRVTRAGFDTRVRGLTARLTAKAARALNRAFGVDAFRKGIPLGRVTVKASPAQTELAPAGATALALDPAALRALEAQGIAPGIVGPGTLSGATASFPIAGGTANLDLSGGIVRHTGGLALTKGATVVKLTAFDVHVGATPQLFASINGGASKVAVLDLDLTGVTPAVRGRTITLAGVTAKLTQGAANTLNAAFGTTAFAGGLTLGRATVTATGR